jgi:GTP-binding protein
MIINSAEFITSAVDKKQYPSKLVPEFAFIGRSNVGKSSLINMLINRKLLARTSGTPGKTRTLNFFCINNEFNIVDMPGYGYAKISKKIRDEFQSIIYNYLKNRESLIYTIILIDSRHKPLASDLNFIESCAEYEIPFIIVFTKIDKLTKNLLNSNISEYKKQLLNIFEELPIFFLTSSVTKESREELLSFIFEESKKYTEHIKTLNT